MQSINHFIPLDVGGPLTLQAREIGYIGVALLFTTDPALLDTGTLRALDARADPGGR